MESRKNIILLSGEPHALVAVSVVDREAYLTFNKTRLVRDSMFDAMASHEQGCMRNGGNDTRNVYLVRICLFALFMDVLVHISINGFRAQQ